VANIPPEPKRVSFTVHASFDASSPARGATSRGTAGFEMTVDFAGGTPTILRETSRVTLRG